MPNLRLSSHISLLAIAGLLAGAAPALAQEPAPGRYSMQKTDTGIARLDTQTGEVTLCQEKAGDLVCRMAADERTAYDLELDLLEKRVETLEKAVRDTPSGFAPRLPTKEEIDQTMGIMDRMMRSFMGIARDFGREWQGEEKTPPTTEPESDLRKT
ncbi:hypothetical protein [Rhizobium sp. NFR03]|uniref:hypothetical protein n=1 Tax=Rhizobium sp. NFR03 TaxID=1566263 RepID=UPI0008C738EF|nr:hypothetical protein [Rhizobium sp. NFR03]SER91857.1 hypothetical protein SAMN03159406_01552 [Rhizobium sp. NFR03]